ncbi:unnamed protein product, partial [Meganyctiphanes norvegica]
GEVIAVETAYASCVDPEEPNSPLDFCTFCLARCAAPLPCPECTNVVFCNEECRSNGWRKFHMKECPVYPQLRKLKFRNIEAYRIIAGQSLDEHRAFVTKFKKDEKISPLEQILCEDEICDSYSYRSVYFLENNIKSTDIKGLIACSIRAFVMTQLMIQSNRYFVNYTEDKNEPDEEDIIFIGSLFIRFLLTISFNSYQIIETHVRVKEVSLVSEESVGSGIYIAGSLFNHSCFPSAMIFFYGNVGVFRASRFIPSGTQVCVCYTEHYSIEPDRAIRRRNLHKAYSFICKCEACLSKCRISFSDWKTSLSAYKVPKLKIKSKRVSRNDNESTESLELELKLLITKFSFITLSLSSPSFDITNCLDLTLEMIEFFDRFVVVPDPMCIQVTTIFQEIFHQKGSCYFVNK